MWAQLRTVRVNDGEADAVRKAMEQLRPSSSQIRDCSARSSCRIRRTLCACSVLVVFESEEKARARENDPRRQEVVQALRASLAEVLQAAPEYTDLNVIADLVS